ncbi:hypothetical protein [Streptomyces albogriseolus]|uniref:hypothetical protein n=1 Tax=Streptomyces albogriseolus TaxID=1887 RepID=UPI00324D6989
MNKDLEAARKAAEEANAKLAELEAEAAAKAAEEAAQRREREEAYAREFLKGFRDRASEAADYKSDFTYDPKTMGFLEGLIRFAEARGKRAVILDEARRAERMLGVPSHQSVVPDDRPYQMGVVAHIERIIREEAQRRVAKFIDEIEAERERFVEGG